MKKTLLAALFLSLTACTDPDSARKALEVNGYTNIQIRGYAGLMCSKDDTYSTKFTAISPAGHSVSGAVCSGLLKAATIRIDV
ncbi:hypothetical protein D9J30_03380 [Escherichia coli]|uniref:Lipoprotein n=1 Tax=Escherichia coli O8 TaxID=1010796 RepID=A0A9P2I552_ECOLX|nr:hypothetical protein [Escherichia albertii]EEW1653566.1 hypothetical protein [Escherichia coli]EFO2014045.1 hypothetical protein [Escherichia coli O8]EFA3940474.1 hypothetical protein [Escherichia coli]EFO2024343.1 hypothetical protein [Escherichia coli O8]EFO2033509.1 hypothetical protein [Escherichia coli O8]